MSDTENIVFKKGLGNLPLPNVENGSVLIETDSGRMYIDDNDVRTQISRKISNGDELPTEGVKEGDIFLKNGVDNSEEDMFNLLYPIVNEHVNADNPHGITREYLGAAKEGYVYKSINDVDTEADLENALNAELATMSGNTVRFLVISPITSNYLFGGCGTLCELYCRTKDYGTAKFTWYSDYKTPNIAYKNIYGGVWGPLAWLNPPMVFGVLYRTTERWNGKAIYKQLVNLGSMPSTNGEFAVATGIDCTKYRIIDSALALCSGSGVSVYDRTHTADTFDYQFDSRSSGTYYVTGFTSADYSPYVGYIIISCVDNT